MQSKKAKFQAQQRRWGDTTVSATERLCSLPHRAFAFAVAAPQLLAAAPRSVRLTCPTALRWFGSHLPALLFCAMTRDNGGGVRRTGSSFAARERE